MCLFRAQGGISTLGVVHRLEMRFSPDSHGELRASLVRRGNAFGHASTASTFHFQIFNFPQGEGKCVWSCFNFPFSGRTCHAKTILRHAMWPCAVFQILTTLRIFDEYFRTGRTRAERHQQLSFVLRNCKKTPTISIHFLS